MERSALVLIDLQNAIDDPSWGTRNNPDAERRVQRMLALWRHLQWPVFHIRHDSRTAGSTYTPGTRLHAFKPETAPREGETVLGKWTCSAFASTDLLQRLRGAGVSKVFVCGVITNNSVEATVRAGGDLGLEMYLVEDACFTFGKGRFPADDVHAMSLANIDGEYGTVTQTAQVVGEYLEGLYRTRGREMQRARALQAAVWAQRRGADETTVIAALLHDIGALLDVPDAETGRALLLSLGFDSTVTEAAPGDDCSGTPAEIPGFAFYRPMIEAHLNALPSQQG